MLEATLPPIHVYLPWLSTASATMNMPGCTIRWNSTLSACSYMQNDCKYLSQLFGRSSISRENDFSSLSQMGNYRSTRQNHQETSTPWIFAISEAADRFLGIFITLYNPYAHENAPPVKVSWQSQLHLYIGIYISKGHDMLCKPCQNQRGEDYGNSKLLLQG